MFTNDIVGLVKILAIIFFTVEAPVAALVVYFLKRGPDGEIAALRSDLNGLGGRVSNTEKAIERVVREVGGINQTIITSQRQIMDAIREAGTRQTEAMHVVEIEVTRLKEHSDLAKAITGITSAVERLIERNVSVDR